MWYVHRVCVYAQEVLEVQMLIVCRCVSMHAAAYVCYTQVSVDMCACCTCVCLLNAGVSMHSFTETREQHQVSPSVSLLLIV